MLPKIGKAIVEFLKNLEIVITTNIRFKGKEKDSETKDNEE